MMQRFFSTFFIAALLPHFAYAADTATPATADIKPVEVKFTSLKQLGNRAKPRNSIDTTTEALDFILADKIVRASIIKAMAQGYDDWKAQSERVKGDDIWNVRVDSTSVIPPYSCYFRFDSIGNDKREIPSNGCQYE